MSETNTPISDVEAGDGRPVIVRSRDQGVMCGQFAGRVGSTVRLTNARQLWRWRAAQGGTLVDVAQFGVVGKDCKFSEANADVTVIGACAVIEATPAAVETIRAVKGGDWR